METFKTLHTSVRIDGRRLFVHLRCITDDADEMLSLATQNRYAIQAFTEAAARDLRTEVRLRVDRAGVTADVGDASETRRY